MIRKKAVFCYIKDTYGVDPDFPWQSDPASAVFRHTNNRKWFALFMQPAGNHLGLDTADCVEILNVKCDPLMIGSLRNEAGVLPAYHMNKEHWCTILLDGPLPAETVLHLLDLSYAITK